YYSVGFFFQAEDGIRDFHVTGVQTCALPIYRDADRVALGTQQLVQPRRRQSLLGRRPARGLLQQRGDARADGLAHRPRPRLRLEIGRASCRERWTMSVLGGASDR